MTEIFCNYEDTLLVEPLNNRREVKLATNCCEDLNNGVVYLGTMAAKKLVKELQDFIRELEKGK